MCEARFGIRCVAVSSNIKQKKETHLSRLTDTVVIFCLSATLCNVSEASGRLQMSKPSRSVDSTWDVKHAARFSTMPGISYSPLIVNLLFELFLFVHFLCSQQPVLPSWRTWAFLMNSATPPSGPPSAFPGTTLEEGRLRTPKVWLAFLSVGNNSTS